MKYTHRYIARIILEAETALFVGSGETSLLKDALVQKDHLGFPMIQGTSLMGVLRHAIEDPWKTKFENEKDEEIKKEYSTKLQKLNQFFGFQKDNKGVGSKVKISSAYFLLPNNQVAEGYASVHQEVLQYFKDLPSRQHVRITHHGVADSKDGGLFENEVVHKGCKFIFEMEVKGDGSETEQWEELLQQLKNPLFRIGQGTRNGYGKLIVTSCKKKEFNLNDGSDFEAYLQYDPSFNVANECLIEVNKTINYSGAELTHYHLDLIPDALFIFGSGYGDEEVDNKPFTEEVMVYNEETNKIEFKEQTVIPGSSIKGAISHRTCFHYNKMVKVYADEIDFKKQEEYVGKNNDAVYHLFGTGADNDKSEKKRDPHRGKVIIDDLYYSDINNEKIFNHVAIDRFTGGALNGALYSEKVSHRSESITLNVWVERNKGNDNVNAALEKSLKDICKGLLPLGGMTTKGHGIFTGTISKNGNDLPL